MSILTSSIYNVSLIHRGDPHFNIACGIEGCYSTFRRYSSFTSHISKKHVFNKIQNVSIHNFFLSTLKNHNPAKLSDLVGHLGTHIRNDESLICPHENCNRTYQCVFILRLVDSCQSYAQGLVTIFIFFRVLLKTTREESKMSNFHTPLFQNSFVLVS